MLPISNTDRLTHFDRMFIDWLGGQTVYDMLVAHHQGCTFRDLAEQHRVSVGTAHSWVTAAKVKMRRIGMNVESVAPHQQPRPVKSSTRCDEWA